MPLCLYGLASSNYFLLLVYLKLRQTCNTHTITCAHARTHTRACAHTHLFVCYIFVCLVKFKETLKHIYENIIILQVRVKLLMNAYFIHFTKETAYGNFAIENMVRVDLWRGHGHVPLVSYCFTYIYIFIYLVFIKVKKNVFILLIDNFVCLQWIGGPSFYLLLTNSSCLKFHIYIYLKT